MWTVKKRGECAGSLSSGRYHITAGTRGDIDYAGVRSILQEVVNEHRRLQLFPVFPRDVTLSVNTGLLPYAHAITAHATGFLKQCGGTNKNKNIIVKTKKLAKIKKK